MAENTLLTIDDITQEVMFQLENNLTFTKYVNRNYDSRFARTGAKIGDTITIRLPTLATIRTGRVAQIEALQEQSVALTLDQAGSDWEFSSADLLLSIDDFSERFIKSRAATVANYIDEQGCLKILEVANSVGVPGTIPNALLTYRQAAALLDKEAVPRDGMRSVIIDPDMETEITNALQGLFHSSSEIERQYEEGTMGLSAGLKWSMDQNVPLHTVGPLGGTPQINGAGQTGASLITDGWTAAAALRLNQGDVIQIDNVNSVNPRSKRSNREQRFFRVTANVSSDGAGNATIPINPPIITTGAYQNVDLAPADGAAINVFGSATPNQQTIQGCAFHRDAFVMASVDMPHPGGTHEVGRISDEQLGISLRVIWDYDVVHDIFIGRIDVLFGWVLARPELAVRIAA